MKRCCIFCLCLMGGIWAACAGPLLDYQRSLIGGTHVSLSRQFIVHDVPPGTLPSPFLLDQSNLVELDPTLLTVSCERIKKCLLKELGMRDAWMGKIFIGLHPAGISEEPISVTPARFGAEWDYELDMPDHVERARLVSAIVEVLLLEIADRGSERSTEIPTWLSQGMSREVMFTSEEELVLEKPNKIENGLDVSRLTRTNVVDSPLLQAHADLLAMPPLKIEELSWPKMGQFDGAAAEQYRSSAQLLVHDLLQLNDGRECLRAFLGELPRHLNWQIAFLRAFRSHFGTQLEWEKWWALQLVQFTGRDLAQTWQPAESWQKLDEIVRPYVDVRTEASDLPTHTHVTLQAIIRDWDVVRQTQLLQEKSQQLLLLRLHVSQNLVYLVDDYRRTLYDYLKKRDSSGVNPYGRARSSPIRDQLAKETIHTLDVLEERRQQLRPNPQIPPTITAKTASNN
ncbi:MAG TPA: hypothetical protein VFB72_03910 [Verrucomicrobiae bacterium]|nr:hypothetical protein [Verrucomicrobiae bacterium]